MSRRKDRERFLAAKRLDPSYAGFRGRGQQPSGDNADLQAVTCSICGRQRNVSAQVAVEESDSYVCLSCREAELQELEPEEVSSEITPDAT